MGRGQPKKVRLGQSYHTSVPLQGAGAKEERMEEVWRGSWHLKRSALQRGLLLVRSAQDSDPRGSKRRYRVREE